MKTPEWQEDAKYNPFNSWKALVHADHFEAILKRENILPPIVLNFDLTNKCNYNCRFCMFGARKRTDPSMQGYRFNKAELPEGFVLQLPKLWHDWGVKSACLSGGGEPTLHPDCIKVIPLMKKNDIQLGFVTNGFLVNNDKWWKTINESCRFIGVSMDAGNENDYHVTKGVPKEWFHVVINNLKNIAATKENLKTNLQIGYKYVIEDTNYKSIYDAIRIASEIGVTDFHLRPSIYPNPEFFSDKLDMIWEQVEKGRDDFEREDFRVYAVQHKFHKDLSKRHNFKKCRATMLTTTWAADGWLYLDTDTRGAEWAKLVKYYPDPQKAIAFWGSKKHWKIVDAIDHSKCDRCTLAAYNEFFEKVFIEDRMDRFLI